MTFATVLVGAVFAREADTVLFSRVRIQYGIWRNIVGLNGNIMDAKFGNKKRIILMIGITMEFLLTISLYNSL